MKGSSIARGKGRPRKIVGETIKRDLNFNSLNVNMIYDRSLWHHLIHVSRPHLVRQGLIVIILFGGKKEEKFIGEKL